MGSQTHLRAAADPGVFFWALLDGITFTCTETIHKLANCTAATPVTVASVVDKHLASTQENIPIGRCSQQRQSANRGLHQSNVQTMCHGMDSAPNMETGAQCDTHCFVGCMFTVGLTLHIAASLACTPVSDASSTTKWKPSIMMPSATTLSPMLTSSTSPTTRSVLGTTCRASKLATAVSKCRLVAVFEGCRATAGRDVDC